MDTNAPKTHPHHPLHARTGGKPKPELTAHDLARLEAIQISTRDDAAKPASAVAQTAPAHSQHLHPHAIPGPVRSVGNTPQSGTRTQFSPNINDFVAAQNGARILAALAAGPGGVPTLPVPQFHGGLNGARQHAPAPLAFPGHPIGVPMGLSQMPLTPPAAAAYGFPSSLSAGHPPLYDFAALQQQHILELAAAQQAAQAVAIAQGQQGLGAPLSPPTNLTSGVSPAASRSPNDVNAATLALLQQGIVPPGFAQFPGTFPSPQFYPSPTDGQYGPEFVAAMARALPQYAAAMAAAAAAQAQYPGVDANTVAALNLATSVQNGGPSANNRKLGLYKTELCRSWEEKGTCRYGPKCQFAHGEDELRNVQRHPKYKTEICRTFWVSGSCPYGKRCCFIHTELPGPGAAAPGAGGASGSAGATPEPGSAPASAATTTPATSATANAVNAPERTPSANSSNAADGTEKEQSLLARINAKRKEESSSPSPAPSVGFGRPQLGGLRVDTSALDGGASLKQNKSAFPTFASNQTIPTVDNRNEAPPATAGPEFGRQRLEVMGMSKSTSGNTHMRSLSNTDTSTSALHQSSRSLSGNLPTLTSGNTPDSATAPTLVPAPASAMPTHGHSRSTSGSHWAASRPGPGTAVPSQGTHLTALSAFPRDTDQSPWQQAATAAPTGRYPNRAWAS